MRGIVLWFVALFAMCGTEPKDSDPGETGEPADSPADTGESAEPVDTVDTSMDPHAIGREAASFVLEDINPSSAYYGQMVDSADLEGQAYALIFLDSRCGTCDEVADDLWAEFEAHPTWFDLLPTFGVQSWAAMASNPETVENQVDGNALPYLEDTEEVFVWAYYDAGNHEFFAISAEGTIDAYFAMYLWPDELSYFTDYMTERFGE